MAEILSDSLQELFIALTCRYNKDGQLQIGISQEKLLLAAEITKETLDEMLKQLKNKVEELGMEIVEYIYKGQLWYAVRSNHSCPTELEKEEEATLGCIIEAIENSRGKSEIRLTNLQRKLVDGKYLTKNQLDKTLRHLEQLGYIERLRKGIQYSPRVLLEFSEEARKHIAEESGKLIF